jgi:hypothetical protein
MGFEADCQIFSSAKVKNVWSYTSIPPHAFMVWCILSFRPNYPFLTYMLHRVLCFIYITLVRF